MVADRTARKKSILSMRFPVIANTPQLGLAIHQRQKNMSRHTWTASGSATLKLY